jgi:hypothetical protein
MSLALHCQHRHVPDECCWVIDTHHVNIYVLCVISVLAIVLQRMPHRSLMLMNPSSQADAPDATVGESMPAIIADQSVLTAAQSATHKDPQIITVPGTGLASAQSVVPGAWFTCVYT